MFNSFNLPSSTTTYNGDRWLLTTLTIATLLYRITHRAQHDLASWRRLPTDKPTYARLYDGSRCNCNSGDTYWHLPTQAIRARMQRTRRGIEHGVVIYMYIYIYIYFVLRTYPDPRSARRRSVTATSHSMRHFSCSSLSQTAAANDGCCGCCFCCCCCFSRYNTIRT